MPRHLRVFISSPGDVTEERQLARMLFKEKLPVMPWLRNQVTFDLISWDDPHAQTPLPAHLNPQEAINRGLPRPSECDIVVVFFGARMGTPLPEEYKKDDGSRYQSGTEYEFLDALKSAKANGRPEILLYRCRKVPNPRIDLPAAHRREIEDQWNKVEAFFASLSDADGSLRAGFSAYDEPAEFRTLLEQHMHALLARQLDKPVEPGSDLFLVPDFTGAVPRGVVLDRLSEACAQSPVVCIMGISGNGKTHLATQLVMKLVSSGKLKSALWCEAEKDESLDGLLSKLHACVKFQSQSVQTQCKELMNFLVREQCLLVVDDYQLSNRDSYAPLVRRAVSYRAPARLVLITNIYPDELTGHPSATVFRADAFSLQETGRLMSSRGVDLSEGLRQEVLEKTGALPLAISLFCALVKDRGHDPRDLLSGDWANITRLKRWFGELGSSITIDAVKLLNILALTDGPFDRRVIATLCREIMRARSERMDLFEELLSAFLVEQYGENRWKVHDLVANMCHGSLNQNVANATHTALANHFNRISGGWRPPKMEDATLQLKIRACKHFSKAPYNSDQVCRILVMIAAEIKRRGHYRQFIELSGEFLARSIEHDRWIDYHYAHCCLILGLIPEGLEAAERLTRSTATANPRLSLSASRLYAEALHASGNSADAEQLLVDALRVARKEGVTGVPLEQAETALAGIETALGRIDRASARIAEVLQATIERGNRRGEAVVRMRLGIVHLARGELDAAKREFGDAHKLFCEAADLRGQAWALIHLCEAELRLDRRAEALKALRETIEIYSEIEVLDRDYLAALDRLRGLDDEGTLSSLVEGELRRLELQKLHNASSLHPLRA